MTTSTTPETLPSLRLPRRLALPDFPWDPLTPYREWAAQYPDGVVDLTVGTPVGPTPEIAHSALFLAINAPDYSTAVGAPVVRAAIAKWVERRRDIAGLGDDEIIPTIGSKESMALLPLHLGMHPGDLVLHPRAAYPTYDVGTRLARATPVPVDAGADPAIWDIAEGTPVAVVWLNSPGDPDRHVLSVEQMAQIVAWARTQGAVVISDEYYAEFGWETPWGIQPIPSLLDPRIGGAEGRSGLLALYSLSKRSNLTGYQATFLTGDTRLVGAITEVRERTGVLMPTPVQAALVAALGNGAHMEVQEEVYRERREVLVETTVTAGLIDDPASVAGLYLWLRGPESMSAYELMGAFAELGVVVALDDFCDEAGAGWVCMSLTDTGERVTITTVRLHFPETAALFAG